MPPEKVRPPAGNQGAQEKAPADGLSAATLLASADIQTACTLHLVLLVSRSGKFVRKPYLSLHSAQAALQRAQERGQECHLVLCRVEPLTADLELEVGP